MINPPRGGLGKRQAIRIFLKPWIVRLMASVTLCVGVLDLYSLMGRALPERAKVIREIFPLEFLHVARFATLLTGFALVIVSASLWRRKKRAWQALVLVTSTSVALHLVKGLDYEAALLSLGLLTLLFMTRKMFTVRSRIPDLRGGGVRLGLVVGAALAYGIAGFWFLDPREFGVNFHLGDAVHQTVLFLTLQGDPRITPHTRHARWFLESMYLTTAVTLAYAMFELFRPVIYRFRTLPHEKEHAMRIVNRYGQTGLDYFKLWHDKSFFFSPSGESFLAYKVGKGYAAVLGDPLGPLEEMEELVRVFEHECRENDWRVVFYQATPEFLPLCRKLGFRKLKIGDDAVVDLTEFGLDGKRNKKLRMKVAQLEKEGVRLVRYEAPVPEETLREARSVSDSWLRIPGRRERTFTLGMFDEDYVRETTVFGALDGRGRLVAFLNEIPAYRKGEATLDLMRYSQDAPPGIMDYMFAKVLLEEKQRGYVRFSLGMAPMSGFQEREESSREERAVHYFMQRLNFLFNYQGLRFFKAKFATVWEPRYLVYRNVFSLPRVANAIAEVSEIHD